MKRDVVVAFVAASIAGSAFADDTTVQRSGPVAAIAPQNSSGWTSTISNVALDAWKASREQAAIVGAATIDRAKGSGAAALDVSATVTAATIDFAGTAGVTGWNYSTIAVGYTWGGTRTAYSLAMRRWHSVPKDVKDTALSGLIIFPFALGAGWTCGVAATTAASIAGPVGAATASVAVPVATTLCAHAGKSIGEHAVRSSYAYFARDIDENALRAGGELALIAGTLGAAALVNPNVAMSSVARVTERSDGVGSSRWVHWVASSLHIIDTATQFERTLAKMLNDESHVEERNQGRPIASKMNDPSAP